MMRSVSFPALTDVPGDLLIQSDVNLDCSSLDSMQKQNETVKGSFECIGTAAQASTDATSMGSATPQKGGLSQNAKVGVGVGVGIGCLFILGGVFIFFTRRRRRAALNEDYGTATYDTLPSADEKQHEADNSAVHELASGSVAELRAGAETRQLPIESGIFQLPTGDETQEMPAEHGQSELLSLIHI